MQAGKLTAHRFSRLNKLQVWLNANDARFQIALIRHYFPLFPVCFFLRIASFFSCARFCFHCLFFSLLVVFLPYFFVMLSLLCWFISLDFSRLRVRIHYFAIRINCAHDSFAFFMLSRIRQPFRSLHVMLFVLYLFRLCVLCPHCANIEIKKYCAIMLSILFHSLCISKLIWI